MPESQDREPQPPPPGQPDRRQTQAQGWYAMAGAGMEFAVAVVMFTLLGWYLDARWNSSPWLILTGVALGFAIGLWMLIRTASRSFRD
jgi:F0F1-type ATP synthase assembly protein I